MAIKTRWTTTPTCTVPSRQPSARRRLENVATGRSRHPNSSNSQRSSAVASPGRSNRRPISGPSRAGSRGRRASENHLPPRGALAKPGGGTAERLRMQTAMGSTIRHVSWPCSAAITFPFGICLWDYPPHGHPSTPILFGSYQLCGNPLFGVLPRVSRSVSPLGHWALRAGSPPR